MKGYLGWMLSLAVCLLMCVSVTGAVVSGQTASGDLQCNAFLPNDHYGVLTSSCEGSDDLAKELLTEGSNVGVMGGLKQTNDTITGRYTTFRLNEENMTIESFGIWVDGGIYQVFDGITFNDALTMSSSIEGPTFNASFDNTHVRIHNHPSGVLRITADRSASIKFTMAGGINANMIGAAETGNASIEAARVGGNNVTSIVMVTHGSLEPAGNRSLMVNLAKGGEVLFRAGSDATPEQKQLLGTFPSQDMLAEYWVLSRDEGAIYDLTAYDDVTFASSDAVIKLGDWNLKMPDQLPGRIIGVHTDKMTVTISGGIGSMLALSGIAPEAAQSMEDLLQAPDEAASMSLYFMEQKNNRVDIYLYVPADVDPSGNPNGTAGAGDPDGTGDNTSLLLLAGLGAGIVAIVGGALWIRRSKR